MSTHRDRTVTMPNNDTLYASAWLDFSGGPIDIDVPLDTDRYVSLALMSAFSDVVGVVGNGGRMARPRRLRVVGPGWQRTGETDRELVRMPSEDGWALMRTHVADVADLLAANAVQDRLQLAASGAMTRSRPVIGPSAGSFLDTINARLGRADPRYPPARALRRFAELGVRPGQADVFGDLSKSVRQGWEAAVARGPGAQSDMSRHGRVISGWSYPHANIANFGTDERFRAAVALSGIGALPQSEPIYMTAVADAHGHPLQPGMSYRLDLPPVPVDAFWSLSAYRAEPDGRFYFVDNPIGRYSIGSHTPGLRRLSDGTAKISIASRSPDNELANWLPLPDGPFRLVLRAYRPRPALQKRRWTLPALHSDPRLRHP